MGKYYEAEGQYLHYGQYSNCLKGSVFDFTISLMASTSHMQTKFPAEINESFLVDLMRTMRKCDVSLTFFFFKTGSTHLSPPLRKQGLQVKVL